MADTYGRTAHRIFPPDDQRRPVRPFAARLLRYGLKLLTRLPPVRPRPGSRSGRPEVTLVIAHAYGMGGTVAMVLTLAEHLRHTCTVRIATVFRTRKDPFFPLPEGVEIITLDNRLRKNGRGWRRRVRDWLYVQLSSRHSVLVPEQDRMYPKWTLWVDIQFARHLRRLSASSIAITTRPGLNIAAATLRPRHLVLVGQEHVAFAWYRDPMRSLMHTAYRALDAFVVLTEVDRVGYEAVLGSHGVLIRRIPNSLRRTSAIRSNQSAKVIAAAGRYEWSKGFELLIQSFTYVAEKHSDWKLVLYGRGTQEQLLRQEVERLELTDKVDLAGESKTLQEDLARASIFASSSRLEGFGLVILEAMSVGLPVVAFDASGPAETITNNHDGILVPSGDIRALADGLIELIEDDNTRHRMASNAVATASRYTMSVVGSQWDQFIQDVLRSRKRHHL